MRGPGIAKGAGVRALYWGLPSWDPGLLRQWVRAALDLDYVRGIDFYLPWALLEPTEGKYVWTYFDEPLAIAEEKNKTVGLGMMVAAHSPAWLMASAKTFTFRHPVVGVTTAPVPWDPTYLKSLTATVHAMGARYDGRKGVYYVTINGPSTLFGVETNWPMVRGSIPAADAERLAFSVGKYVQGWQGMIDTFLDAFRKSQLSLALNRGDLRPTAAHPHPIEEIRDYAMARYAAARGRGQRLLLQLLGLTSQNPHYFFGPYRPGVAPTPYIDLVWSVREKVWIGYECDSVWRWAHKTPEFFQQVLQNGVSWGAIFVKVKYPDIVQVHSDTPYRPYQPALVAADAALRRRAAQL